MHLLSGSALYLYPEITYD